MIRKLLIFMLTFTILSGITEAKIVCTTSVLASIVEDLTGEKCEVIAPPCVCPAHYDIKPSDVEIVREADVIICHGFEPWVSDLVNASGKDIRIVKVPGPWNTPQALRDKYVKIAKVLEEEGYKVNLKKCLDSINETERFLKKFAKENGFIGTPVVCMQWQKGFVEFLGFKVLATYPPPEMVSAKKYAEIVEKGKGAKLVIDNLQSGTELGEKLAKEFGAKEVAISNFPLEGNVTTMMIENAKKLANALKEDEVNETPTEETPAKEEEEKKSPGFEAILAIGLIITIALKRRT
jgi:ABC-type Zn uptake system ZnuABC Zn-binding protein ZnuA